MVVRLTNNRVAEIFPAEMATLDDIAKWYSVEYAASSVLAPEGVRWGMIYDPDTQTFSDPPPSPEPDPSADELINILLGVAE